MTNGLEDFHFSVDQPQNFLTLYLQNGITTVLNTRMIIFSSKTSKQYNMVPVNGQRRCPAGKVAVDVAMICIDHSKSQPTDHK